MFEYPVPRTRELKEKYISKYKFDDEIIEATLYMFKHPKHNKRWYKLCNQWMTNKDANDMIKAAYRVYQEYKDNPQMYGHSLENVSDQMLVSMWKVFTSLHATARKNITDGYKMTAVKQMSKHAKEVWLDKLINCSYVEYSEILADPTRIGLGTQEGKSRGNFEYLVKLGEEEQASLL
jgi:hypothetical protein